MKISAYMSALKSPNILNSEFGILYEELGEIEQELYYEKNKKAIGKLKKDKAETIYRLNEIVDYVIYNKIEDEITDYCRKYLEDRIVLLQSYDYVRDDTINQVAKKLEEINAIRKRKYPKISMPNIEIEDNNFNVSKIELQEIDTSELVLYKRFKHEKPLLEDNELKDNVMEEIKELKYKDYSSYNVNKCDGKMSIHPGNFYSAQKKIPKELIVGSSFYDNTQGVFIDYINGGNIWIETNDFNDNIEQIDNFIVAYIFKILEAFPLGRVQFKILDTENKWYYKKFEVNMNSENANYLCKNTVEIYKDKNKFFNDVIIKKCNEISKKMTAGINNIYNLCSADPDEVIRFVIVRNPLDTFNNDELETILPLIRTNDTAHRCGFRFLTILNSKKMEDLSLDLLNQILLNSEIQFRVEDQMFKLDESIIQQLQIDGDVTQFVEESSSALLSDLIKVGSTTLIYEDLYPKDEKNIPFDSSIIEIPVGKYGREIFELPFSAANEEQTLRGEIVNYMVIGTTGSGKSSLMHSIIINGARKYSPNDLRFWVLDFKEGKESEKYKYSNIPHIELLSSKNTQEDAVYIFKMILEEVSKRAKKFSGYKDIHQYNKHMDEIGKPHVPHVIVIVDEAQELAANKDSTDNVDILRTRIAEISSKIRAFGFHLVLIAQNITSSSFFSSYLPQARGRITFSLDEGALSDANFGTEFYNLREEISKLSVGNAYIGINYELYKTKFAYASSLDKYFKEIRDKYSDNSNLKTKIVGDDSKLLLTTKIPLFNKCYNEIISELKNEDSHNQEVIIGENSYSLDPMKIQFNPDKKSSLLIMGDSNKMATSIMKSIVKSLESTKDDIYVVNGDKTNYVDEINGERLGNSLTKYCQLSKNSSLQLFTIKEVPTLFEKIYKEFVERRDQSASSIDEISFKPIFVILNDVSTFDLSKDTILFESNSHDYNEDSDELQFNRSNIDVEKMREDIYNLADKIDPKNRTQNVESISIINAFKDLVQYGYKMSIYMVVSMIGAIEFELMDIKEMFAKCIVYNNIDNDLVPDVYGNSRAIKDMLKTIKNDTTEETRALLIDNDSIIKIRPVIYDMQKEEREMEGKYEKAVSKYTNNKN